MNAIVNSTTSDQEIKVKCFFCNKVDIISKHKEPKTFDFYIEIPEAHYRCDECGECANFIHEQLDSCDCEEYSDCHFCNEVVES